MISDAPPSTSLGHGCHSIYEASPGPQRVVTSMNADAVDFLPRRRIAPHQGSVNDDVRRGDRKTQRLRHVCVARELKTAAAIADVDHTCLGASDHEHQTTRNFRARPLALVGSLLTLTGDEEADHDVE